MAPSCYLDLSADGLLKVVFPFDGVTDAQLKKVRPKGTWNGVQEGWQFPLSAAQELLEQLGSRFLVTNDLARWLQLVRHPLGPLPSHEQLMVAASLDRELPDGRSLFPHQRFAVSWLLSRKAALLADEMGLGKTLTALLASQAIVRSTDALVMVIAPSCLHSLWTEEANAIDLPIILKSWASLPRDLPNQETVLIVDEAHFAQSIKANRTQALLRLSRHPRLRAIWLLTGTPIKNGYPSQLFPLLAAMQHPIASNKKKFHRDFVDDQHQNLLELHEVTASFILQRRKLNLIKLPPKTRIKYPVKLDSAKALGFERRVSLVIDDYRFRVQQGLVRSETESLVLLTALRQIGAEFKLPEAYSLIKGIIDKDQSVVCFSSFVTPLILLRRRLGGELVTGRQSIKERDKSIKRFQSNPSSLLLTTYGSGGLGLNLMKANHVVLLERPWTPGDVNQAEDRCHRIGSKWPLKSHWLQLGIADQLVDATIENKEKRIDLFLGNRQVSIERQSLSEMVRLCMQFL